MVRIKTPTIEVLPYINSQVSSVITPKIFYLSLQFFFVNFKNRKISDLKYR